MIGLRWLPLPVSAALLLSTAVPAAEIGRLFYTPDQRSSLDVARSKRVRTTVATEETSEEPPPPAPEVVTYSGMVRRSDGKTTVWLNSRPMTGAEAASGPMAGKVRPDGSVSVQGTQSARVLNLKVGQRAELVSGTVEEAYVPRAQPAPEAADRGPGESGGATASKPAADAPARASTPAAALPAGTPR